MPAPELDLLIEAARAAGHEARKHQGGDLEIEMKSQELGPVTNADLAVNALLEARLRGARPDYGWLSEESAEDPHRMRAERVFVIDPIDGTRAFIAGEKAWAHALAVLEDGLPIAAVVYLPMLDMMYTATLGGGATLNGRALSAAPDRHESEIEVLAPRPGFDARHWPGGVPQVKRAYRPSLAYRLSLVAEGRYDAMFTFRPTFDWDLAAGALILSEAGARVTDRHGAALRFNGVPPQSDGVLAANPSLHGQLLARMHSSG